MADLKAKIEALRKTRAGGDDYEDGYDNGFDDALTAASDALEEAQAVRAINPLAIGSDDDPESIAHALSIARIGHPYRDYQGALYAAHGGPYRDAEFRDYGLARAVRVICNNAAEILDALTPSGSK